MNVNLYVTALVKIKGFFCFLFLTWIRGVN